MNHDIYDYLWYIVVYRYDFICTCIDMCIRNPSSDSPGCWSYVSVYLKFQNQLKAGYGIVFSYLESNHLKMILGAHFSRVRFVNDSTVRLPCWSCYGGRSGKQYAVTVVWWLTLFRSGNLIVDSVSGTRTWQRTNIHTYIHTYVRTYIHTLPLHCIALHSIPLHCITLHCIALHYITVDTFMYNYIYIYIQNIYIYTIYIYIYR